MKAPSIERRGAVKGAVMGEVAGEVMGDRIGGVAVDFIEGLEALARLQPHWRDLERRALEPNAYLSPRFVLPALSCLGAPAPPRAVAVWSSGSPRELLALAVFHRGAAHGRFPLPHLRAYGVVHAYQGGVLLDAERAAEALEDLLDALAAQGPGLHLRDLPWNGPTAVLLRAATARRGLSWHEQSRYERACLDLNVEGAAARWEAHLPKARRREAARLQRRLQEQGALRWHWLKGAEVGVEALEDFLALEHAGWKGSQGSSLRSDPAHEAFFVQMAQGFAREGDLFFNELRLDGRPIASSCNLRSGDHGFAFKVAFDPAFARCAPGILNELGLLSALEHDMDGLRHLDSGTQAGSYIEALWPDRRTLVTGTLALRPVGEVAGRAASIWSQVRGRLRQRLRGRRGVGLGVTPSRDSAQDPHEEVSRRPVAA